MTSEPVRDPLADHLLTPQNCALVIIDYQPIQVRSGAQGVLGWILTQAFETAGWAVVRAGRRPDPGAGFRHVDLDEPADWRSADRSGSSGQRSATSWSRRPAPQRWVNSVELDPFQTKLRLLAPLATPRIKAAVAQNLGKLKLLLERPVQHKDFCRGNAIGTDKANYIK